MAVKDWQIPLKTAEMSGKRWLQVHVLDEAGEKMSLSSDALKPLAGRPELTPLILKSNAVSAAVTLDDTAVEGVKFRNLPAEWKEGKDLEVTVTTNDRPESRYAKIDKVIFYLGKETQGKIEAEEQRAGTPKNVAWTATLRTPDKEGKLEVAVQFWTANGKVAAKSDFVMLKVQKSGEVTTTLKGKVTYGDNLPGAMVKLKDAKGAVKGEQKTDDKGAFAFEKVAPGDYTIEASAVIPSVFGRAGVSVPPGKDVVEKDVPVKIKTSR